MRVICFIKRETDRQTEIDQKRNNLLSSYFPLLDLCQYEFLFQAWRTSLFLFLLYVKSYFIFPTFRNVKKDYFYLFVQFMQFIRLRRTLYCIFTAGYINIYFLDRKYSQNKQERVCVYLSLSFSTPTRAFFFFFAYFV